MVKHAHIALQESLKAIDMYSLGGVCKLLLLVEKRLFYSPTSRSGEKAVRAHRTPKRFAQKKIST